jgi:hypothetical protein
LVVLVVAVVAVELRLFQKMELINLLRAVQVAALVIAIRQLVRVIPVLEAQQSRELQVVRVRAVIHVQTQVMVAVVVAAVEEQMVVQEAQPLMPTAVLGSVRVTEVIGDRISLLLVRQVPRIRLQPQTTVW